MSDFTLSATARSESDQGKGASRRLRRLSGRIPAIIYGGDTAPTAISILHKDIHKALQSEAFFSSILDIDVDGTVGHAILKDLHRHPAKDIIIHADFMRVDMNRKITIHVPLHYINEDTCPGVKMNGGMIAHNATDVEVSCLPGNLPEYIEVDMSEAEIGSIIHISDLTLPEGVESVALSHGADHDLALAQVNAPKAEVVEDEEEDAASEDDAAAEEGGDAE
jgi:large subunit ribosomal protein L25